MLLALQQPTSTSAGALPGTMPMKWQIRGCQGRYIADVSMLHLHELCAQPPAKLIRPEAHHTPRAASSKTSVREMDMEIETHSICNWKQSGGVGTLITTLMGNTSQPAIALQVCLPLCLCGGMGLSGRNPLQGPLEASTCEQEPCSGRYISSCPAGYNYFSYLLI